MKKKWICTCLSVVLLFSSLGSVAFASNNNSVSEATINFTNDVIVEGIKIGTVEVTTTTSGYDTEDGGEFTVNLSKDYTLYPEYIEEYGSVFFDYSKQSEMTIVNHSDLYIDGVKKDLSAFDKASPAPNYVGLFAADNAGIPAICHYYSNSARTSYSFQAYESMNYNWFGDGNGHGEPEGKHVSRTGISPSNQHFSSARNDVILFEDGYDAYRAAYLTVLSTLTAELYLSAWFGGAGLVAIGVITSVEAAGVVYLFNEAVSDAERAYDSITYL